MSKYYQVKCSKPERVYWATPYHVRQYGCTPVLQYVRTYLGKSQWNTFLLVKGLVLTKMKSTLCRKIMAVDMLICQIELLYRYLTL